MKRRYLNFDEKMAANFGERTWLNFLNRSLLQSSMFKRSIEEYEVTGIISNAPAMAQCIAHNEEYRKEIRQFVKSGLEPEEIYINLVIEDAKAAADLLLSIFENSNGCNGFVGIDLLPEYAYDVDALIEEANTIWHKACRPNIMIQMPATEEALPAFKELMQSGINVNATLLCSLSRYRDIIQAHIDGIHTRLAKGLPIKRIASAATFSLPGSFERIAAPGDSTEERDILRHICLSSTLDARRLHYDVFHNRQFVDLAGKGAQSQLLFCIDDALTSYTFGRFCCARDLTIEKKASALEDSSVGEPMPAKLDSISENQSIDIEELLDTLQEEVIKTQVIQMDRALMTLKEHHEVKSC